MFPILAGNSASTGYNLTRSLRTRASASAYLSRTPATAGNQRTWTYSNWITRGTLGATQNLFTVGTGSGLYFYLRFLSTDVLEVFTYDATGATFVWQLQTTQVFRDPSAWYHIVISTDTTQATAANRVKIYINGTQVTALAIATYPSLNYDTRYNVNVASYINSYVGSAYFDGYITELNSVDGQALTPSSFGSTNALTGVWQPARYTGSYGTNGFYLNFTDNSALTTSSNVGLGKDFSGNGNYWTTNNISITAGVTYDSMTDVPMLTSATAANFAVINPLAAAVGTASNGNLSWTCGASNGNFRGSIAIPASGKFYFEGTVLTTTSASVSISFGVAASTASLTTQGAQSTLYQLFSASTGVVSINGSNVGTLGTFSANDVLQVAVDVTNSKLWLGKNNVFYDSTGGTTGNPTTGANPVTTNSVVGSFAFGSCYQDTLNANFGQRPFSYTPPTGFVAINTYNLPDSTIQQGNKVMDATLYTGTGSTQNIANAAGFYPDLTWIKSRSAATNNVWYDSNRGVTKQIISNSPGGNETTESTGLTTFNSNGFTVGSLAALNTNAATYVAWQFKAGAGTNITNTAGSITSTVSVDASAGFSIVKLTPPASTATVGHGLGVAPSFILMAPRQSNYNYWFAYLSGLGATKYISMVRGEVNTFALWNNTAPTSSVFSIASNFNSVSTDWVAYCWAEISGYSAFRVIPDVTTGTFVYLGFRPKFLMYKRQNAGFWFIKDSSRSPFNVATTDLRYNDASAETTGGSIDFVSNGFVAKSLIGTNTMVLAFAENPFKNSLAR
jgi:hypothetical protein